MKKIPRPYLYLFLACLVAIVVLIAENPTAEKKGDLLDQPLLAAIDKKEITRIEIEHLFDGVQLKKEGEQWWVAPLKSTLQKNLETFEKTNMGKKTTGPSEEPRWFPASTSQIDFVLGMMQDTAILSLVGKNPEKHPPFEVSTALSKQVRFFDKGEKKRVHLHLGKLAGMMQGYLRREGEDEVYLTNRFLQGSVESQLNFWRDRTLWKIDPNEIETIQVTGKKNSWTLAKVDGAWQITDHLHQNANPKTVDADSVKVSNLIQSLANLEASDFVDDPTVKTGLDNPAITLTLMTKTGTQKLMVGNSKEGQSFAKTDHSPQVYLLSKDESEKLQKKLEEFVHF